MFRLLSLTFVPVTSSEVSGRLSSYASKFDFPSPFPFLAPATPTQANVRGHYVVPSQHGL